MEKGGDGKKEKGEIRWNLPVVIESRC